MSGSTRFPIWSSRRMGGANPLTVIRLWPVCTSKLEAIVNAVEAYVQTSPERERSTSKIGEMIMRRLKDLDKVAYVRFASVYLEFQDVSEFMDELKGLIRLRK